MSQIVVVSNSLYATAEARDALTEFLKAKEWPVWHWFQDLWIIASVPDLDSDSRALIKNLRRDILREIPSLRHLIVISADSKNILSGHVHPDSIPWLREYWPALSTAHVESGEAPKHSIRPPAGKKKR